MERAQLDSLNAQGLAVRQKLDGSKVKIDGREIPGIMAPPRIAVLVVDGGEEVTLEAQCAVAMADFPSGPPRRWAPLEHDGKSYAVAGFIPDYRTSEYLLQLGNARTAPAFR